MVKSHEYISRVILDGFSFERKGIKYTNFIRLPNGKIGYRDIKTFNTKMGAYSDENENILSKEFESYLGDLKAKVRRTSKGKHTLRSDDFDLEKIKKYFAYQGIRDDVSIENLYYLEAFLFDKKVKGLKVPGILTIKNNLITNEYNKHVFMKIFEKDKLVIKYDKNNGFLGTNYPVNMATIDARDAVGLSLSPDILLILTSDFSHSILLNYRDVGFDDVTNPSVVETLNRRMVDGGYRRGGGIIISDTKEKLKKYIDKRKNG